MFGKCGSGRTCACLALLAAIVFLAGPVRRSYGAELGAQSEDERAMALLKKGRLLKEAKKAKEAVELWQSIINRFPRSKVRFAVRLELGKYYLDEKDAEKAISFLHRVIEDTTKNENEEQVAEAMFLIGKAYFESGTYGRAFTALRKVTSLFPGTRWCNESYYYIGMGHFRLKNYKQAIEAFQMVGTSISDNDAAANKIEGGRRLYFKVSDDDLLRSLGYEKITVEATSGCGDAEKVDLFPVGMKGRVFVGSLATELGNPTKGDGKLQTWGSDVIKVTYVDRQAADKKHDIPRMHEIKVCGDAKVGFFDGAMRKPVPSVVLDNAANVHVIDSDRDVSDQADSVTVIVRVKEKMDEIERPKTIEEIEKQQELGTEQKHRYKTVQEIKLDLIEYDPEYMQKQLEGDLAGQKGQAVQPPKTIHSGRFLGRIAFLKKPKTEDDKEAIAKLAQFKAEFDHDKVPYMVCEEGQLVEIEYVDEVSVKSKKPVTVTAEASVFPGSLRPLNVFDRQISQQDLKVKTELKTAEATLELGRIYKDLGLRLRANEKFDAALDNCKEVLREKVNDRALLEQTQVMLWKIYFAKGDLDAAARMCWQLLESFGDEATYADDALLQLGMVAEGKKDYNRAIGVYKRLLTLKTTPFKAEAQFKIAECYEKMAEPKQQGVQPNRSMYEKALVEYKAVADKYPNSKFAAEATLKIAEFYYKMRDYARAIEIYDKALEDFPDGQFNDQILLSYGKSLLLQRQYGQAIKKFSQILNDYPQSKFTRIANRYIELAQDRMAEESSGGKE